MGVEEGILDNGTCEGGMNGKGKYKGKGRKEKDECRDREKTGREGNGKLAENNIIPYVHDKRPQDMTIIIVLDTKEKKNGQKCQHLFWGNFLYVYAWQA